MALNRICQASTPAFWHAMKLESLQIEHFHWNMSKIDSRLEYWHIEPFHFNMSKRVSLIPAHNVCLCCRACTFARPTSSLIPVRNNTHSTIHSIRLSCERSKFFNRKCLQKSWSHPMNLWRIVRVSAGCCARSVSSHVWRWPEEKRALMTNSGQRFCEAHYENHLSSIGHAPISSVSWVSWCFASWKTTKQRSYTEAAMSSYSSKKICATISIYEDTDLVQQQ